MNPKIKPKQPSVPITDKRFVYRNSAQTNVQATWRRFGWTPRQPVVQHLPADDTEGGEA